MTRDQAIIEARACRAAKGGTWYVIRSKASGRFLVIDKRTYRASSHGPVSAILGSA